MKQLKVNVGKRGEHSKVSGEKEDNELRQVLERLKKKGLNPMQMCQKLIEHDVVPPEGESWSYDLVMEQCKKLRIK
ncbi:hypothetical protein [Endozoicomonas sp. Mp262]|uniref:hypothetical protein n=1 Tax=Endozoicomonas sp. Mp262 TaxID=2919499 RepID=UPI0021D95ABE